MENQNQPLTFSLLPLSTLADDDDTRVSPPPDHFITFRSLAEQNDDE